MIMKIKVMNYRDAFDYVYNHSYNFGGTQMKSFAIISIQDGPLSDMAFSYRVRGNCKNALNLWFSDVTESGFEDAKKRHPNWVGSLKLITDEDAESIAQLVEQCKENPVEELIIHCRAGQSRSAGVAAAISKVLYDDDSEYFTNSKYTVNMTVYYKVLKALGLDMTPSFS